MIRTRLVDLARDAYYAVYDALVPSYGPVLWGGRDRAGDWQIGSDIDVAYCAAERGRARMLHLMANYHRALLVISRQVSRHLGSGSNATAAFERSMAAVATALESGRSFALISDVTTRCD